MKKIIKTTPVVVTVKLVPADGYNWEYHSDDVAWALSKAIGILDVSSANSYTASPPLILSEIIIGSEQRWTIEFSEEVANINGGSNEEKQT